MVAVNWPPLQSMGLHGFALAKAQIGAKRVQEESVEIREVLGARSHPEEAAAFDGCSHIATESLKTKTRTGSGCQRHCQEGNPQFLPNQETSIISAKVYLE